MKQWVGDIKAPLSIKWHHTKRASPLVQKKYIAMKMREIYIQKEISYWNPVAIRNIIKFEKQKIAIYIWEILWREVIIL